MESGTTSISIGHLGQRQLRWLEQFILAGIIHLQPLAQSLASPEMEKPKHEPSGESSEYLEEVRERWKRDALRRQISGAILPPEVKKRLLKNLSEVMILPPLEPLAEVLDGGRFQIEGGIFNASMSGLYASWVLNRTMLREGLKIRQMPLVPPSSAGQVKKEPKLLSFISVKELQPWHPPEGFLSREEISAWLLRNVLAKSKSAIVKIIRRDGRGGAGFILVKMDIFLHPTQYWNLKGHLRE